MQKLHLVGFTTDQEGLILSARRGARSGGYVLVIDEALEEAVDDLRARRDEAEEADDVRSIRVESALPVREIQARLRQGRSVADVAKAAGVEPDWVERFAPPVVAERGRVIAKVRGASLQRARLGPSAQPVGDAVRHHLADRGVALTADEFDSAWSARQLANGRWVVRFAFYYRAKNQALQFDLDESSGSVSAVDRLSAQLGYVAPKHAPSKTKTSSPSPPRPTAKRPVTSTKFRREAEGSNATSRSAQERKRAADAMRKAAATRAAAAERAAARRAREKAAEARRKEKEAAAREAAAAKERREKEAAKAKAAAAKKKAAAAKRKAAAAKKKAAGKKAPVKKAPAKKKAAGKKAPVKKGLAKKKTPATTKKPSTPATTQPTRPVPAPAHRVARPSPPPPARAQVPAPEEQAAAARPAQPGVRPQFRAGAAEPAAEEQAIRQRLEARRALSERAVEPAAAQTPEVVALPEPASSNGNEASARRSIGRPRRTRPLRAT